MADITEFPTDEGTLYLAGVRDLCHRGLVGWATGAHQDAELVVDALTMALWRCTPDPEGLVHHADRGSQPRLNRSSQQLVVDLTVYIDRVLPRGFASRASCAADC